LWQKLQKSNIQGKIFKVIYNMYQNIKTCIPKGEECSVFFNSEVGVKAVNVLLRQELSVIPL
jgi:hypothetical protein